MIEHGDGPQPLHNTDLTAIRTECTIKLNGSMLPGLHRSHTPHLVSTGLFVAKRHNVPLFRIAQRNRFVLFSGSRGDP